MYYNNGDNDMERTDPTAENDINETAADESGVYQQPSAPKYEEPELNVGPTPEKPVYRYREPWTEPTYRQAKENSYNYYSPNYSNGGTGYVQPERRAYSQYDIKEEKQPKQKKRGGFGRTLALILVCVLLCSAAGAGSAYLVIDHYMEENGGGKTVVIGGQDQNTGDTSSSGAADSYDATATTLTGVDVYKIAEQQVVGITTPYTTQNIFGQVSTSLTSGTGFVISEDGYILTNYHVIEYSAKSGQEITVKFKNGDEYKAQIVGFYEANDVAVIKIEATGLSPVTFADSDDMQVGQAVYCVGNPLGELDFSMTTGYLSALDRLIATDNYTTINMFQMDAAVNSGNSGGPVYDAQGKVIGIVTAKYSESGVEGLGFAIPINDAVKIATDLIEYGYLTGQAYLGVGVRDVESYVTMYYNTPQGAYITNIEEGSCAETAGLKVQDIITGIDDNEITSVESLKRTLRKYSAGDTATVKLYRLGVGNVEVTVTFDENVTNKQ